jgi:hypothetical protein
MRAAIQQRFPALGNITRMRLLCSAILMLAAALTSCSRDEISLDDQFIIYKMEESQFCRVGIDTGGVYRQLIYGTISCYGNSSKYVSVKLTDGRYFYFDKETVLNSPDPSKAVKGPLNDSEYQKVAFDLKLPSLILIHQ